MTSLPELPNEGRFHLPAAHGMWAPLDVVASTGSTNADLLAAAAAGAAEGRVLVAEEQTAGRGRLGRSWTSVPGGSLTFSVLLRPAAVPVVRRGWLTLLTGVAVVTAVRAVSGVGASLKWPNDVLAADAKLAGILAEQTPDAAAVVIGTGLNIAPPPGPVAPGGLPVASLAAAGATVSRDELLIAILDELERWYVAFRADPDPERSGLLAAYRAVSATLGQRVRVELPGGRTLTGTASDLDPEGRLLVAERPGVPAVPVSAGDVVHVRPDQAPRPTDSGSLGSLGCSRRSTIFAVGAPGAPGSTRWPWVTNARYCSSWRRTSAGCRRRAGGRVACIRFTVALRSSHDPRAAR